MGDHFQWETDTDFEDRLEATTAAAPRQRGVWGFWLLTAVILSVILGGWFIGRQRLENYHAERLHDAQAVLTLASEAVRSGDGDLFFSLFSNDATLRATQLLPAQQAAWRAGYTVSQVAPKPGLIQASLTWPAAGETYERLAFFAEENGRWRLAANDLDFWGRRLVRQTGWGEIYYYEVDEQWVQSIITAVDEQVAALCPAQCAANALPFSLNLSYDFGETAQLHSARLPSPRLVALTAAGQPAEPFWELLRQRVTAVLTPVTIRIALPPPNFLNLHPFDYPALADQFMAEQPDIRLELVQLAEMPADYRELLAYDGVAFPPPAAMIAAGEVYELSRLMATDPHFSRDDYYEQIWQAGRWQEQMWFLPHAAGMKLLFYDQELYRQAGLTPPSLRWTWAEMEADIAALRALLPVDAQPPCCVVFLDGGHDLLLAYAYNWETNCQARATIYCATRLNGTRMAVALDWYTQVMGQPGVLPDLTDLSGESLADVRWRWTSALRVEEPIYYEHYLLTAHSGVVPFPGSEQFNGVAPLWVEGSFITRQSAHPQAVWQWLRFLSYQSPLPRYRLVPARPSVARASGYWQTLPRPLGEAMRAAFPFARPILLEEQSYFTEEMVTAVLSGQLAPDEAARQTTKPAWFSNQAK